MEFLRASEADFLRVRQFYWDLIDRMDSSVIGWKKGIYPSDEMLSDALTRGECYCLWEGTALCACVIVNSAHNEGYDGVPWRVNCAEDEVLIPHALAVDPAMQGCGVGRSVVEEIFALAKNSGKKAVRLDILSGNVAAEALYTRAGFTFVQEKSMFYEDTGRTNYRMFEREI